MENTKNHPSSESQLIRRCSDSTGRQAHTLSSLKMSAGVMPRRDLSVRFSTFSDQVFIPKDDATSKSYSHREIASFKRALVQDAQRASALFERAPHESITRGQLYECVGLEAFLSQDVSERTVSSVQMHKSIVLAGQSLYTPEALAQVSSMSSQWTRDRAHSIAASYLEQLTD